MKKTFLLCILVLTFASSLFACSDNSKKNPATPTNPVKATEPAAATKTAADPTQVPSDPTEAPEETPAKTDGGPKLIEKLPAYYFDFTENGWDAEGIGFTNSINLESVINGIEMTFEEDCYDPYFNLTIPYDDIDPVAYNYMALRVKVTRSDLEGQIRFGTVSDNRLWSMIPVTYVASAEWQTVIVEFANALLTSENTLDGSALTMFRFDPFDDEHSPGAITSDDMCILESIGFFETYEEAEAFAGIYIYES